MSHCPAGFVTDWTESATDLSADIAGLAVEIDAGDNASCFVEQQHGLISVTDYVGKCPARAIIH